MADQPDTAKFAALLLAAGSSTRLGLSKQLVQIEGESLVRRMARLLLRQDPERLIVVTGHGSSDVEKHLSDLPLKAVRNSDWEEGIGSSIACGALNCPDDIDGLLIVVCDLWKLDGWDLEQLVTAWNIDISVICVSTWNDGKSSTYGPPALFPRKYIRELIKLEGSQGAKALIARNMQDVRFIPIENAAFDLDTVQDLEQAVSVSDRS